MAGIHEIFRFLQLADPYVHCTIRSAVYMQVLPGRGPPHTLGVQEVFSPVVFLVFPLDWRRADGVFHHYGKCSFVLQASGLEASGPSEQSYISPMNGCILSLTPKARDRIIRESELEARSP